LLVGVDEAGGISKYSGKEGEDVASDVDKGGEIKYFAAIFGSEACCTKVRSLLWSSCAAAVCEGDASSSLKLNIALTSGVDADADNPFARFLSSSNLYMPGNGKSLAF
jgi:hypothetical protein